MKPEMNKSSKISSLLLVIIVILLSLFIVGLGIVSILQMFGVEGLTIGLIVSQTSIVLIAIAFFGFNLKDLFKTFNLKLKISHIAGTFFSVVSIIGFNIVLGAVINFFNLNRDKIDKFTEGTTEAYVADGSVLLMFLMPIVVAPILEELAFRAGLKNVLIDKSKWKPYQYVIISGVLFGLLHWHPGAPTMIPVLVTGFMGIIHSILYLKTKNILYPIASHMAYNFIIMYAASLTV